MAKQFLTGIEILGGDLTVEGEQIFLGEGGKGLSISKLFDSEIYFSADDGVADGMLAFQIEGDTKIVIQDGGVSVSEPLAVSELLTVSGPTPELRLNSNSGASRISFDTPIAGNAGYLSYSQNGNDFRIHVNNTFIGRFTSSDFRVFGDISTLGGNLVLQDTYSSNNPMITLWASGSSYYSFHADNEGSGSDNTRLWLNGPQGGQLVIGPRSGSVRLNQVRIRAGSLVLDTSPYSGSAGYPVAYIRDSGTWTPRVAGTSGNPSTSYHLRTGMYMRIGSLVWISAHVIINTISGGSGTLYLADLPFAAANHNGYRTNLNVALSGVSYVSGGQVWGAIAQNQSAVHFIAQRNGASFQSVGVSGVSNGADIWLTGFYWTDDS